MLFLRDIFKAAVDNIGNKQPFPENKNEWKMDRSSHMYAVLDYLVAADELSGDLDIDERDALVPVEYIDAIKKALSPSNSENVSISEGVYERFNEMIDEGYACNSSDHFDLEDLVLDAVQPNYENDLNLALRRLVILYFENKAQMDREFSTEEFDPQADG